MSFDLSAARFEDGTPIPDGQESVGPVDLTRALKLVQRTFGIEKILSDENSEIVNSYYRQSLPGYSTIYNRWQCMHVALHSDGDGDKAAFFAQAATVSDLLAGAPGQRVLELGCGLGGNTLHLAARHPGAFFVGIDLMAEHVQRAGAKARALPNASFHQASFENLSEALGRFDVIFAVETLCYARNPGRVAASIARLLRPGGRLVIFDAHRRTDFARLPENLVIATRLYEVSTAVTRGFHAEGYWETALSAAGLTLSASDDITGRTQHGLATLHRRALKAFVGRPWQMALRVMPRYLARNTVAGLLGYHVCFGDGPQPDPAGGTITYQRIVAQKPRT